MLKWTYITLAVVLQLAVLSVVVAGFFVVGLAAGGLVFGLCAALPAAVFGAISIVQFVRIEGFESPVLWWPYQLAMTAAKWPLGQKLLMLIACYCVFGWVAYQFTLGNDAFRLPVLP